MGTSRRRRRRRQLVPSHEYAAIILTPEFGAINAVERVLAGGRVLKTDGDREAAVRDAVVEQKCTRPRFVWS